MEEDLNYLEFTQKNYHFNINDEGEIEMSKHEMLQIMRALQKENKYLA